MSEQTAPTGTELILFEEKELNVTMPALIADIDTTIAKAQAGLKALPAITDEESKAKWFVFKDRVTLRKTEFNEKRMPFTRKLNEVVSKFTSREKELDRLALLAEDKLNAWARKALEATRLAKEEEDKKLKARQATIALEARIVEELKGRITAMIEQVQNAAGKIVSDVTKGNYETQKLKLSKDPKWLKPLDPIYYALPAWAPDPKRFQELAEEHFPALSADYCAKAKEVLNNSLKILDVALTNKDEAALLQKAQEESTKAIAEQEVAESQKEAEALSAIAEMDVAHVEEPKVRVKMKLEIQDNEAWPQLMMFWYVNDPEAKTKDCRKKTFAQLITFAENQLNKNGHMLEHPSIIWEEEVKAK